MSNDLISREDLKQIKFNGFNLEYRVNGKIDIIDLENIIKAYQQGWNDAIDTIIDNAPTVEQITRGEWIKIHQTNVFDEDLICFKCNKCKQYKLPIIHVCITEKLDVCPNCGAKMNMEGANDAGARVVK